VGQESLVLRELVPTASVQAHRADREALAERVASDESAAVDVLEHLFPSFDAGESDGAPMTSVASTSHLSKLDVIHLQEELDRRCKESNARPFGVCPVRESIYKDCLDEIIRQVTVTCPERGELLAELQSEVGETQRTYDMLFESACQYGARKAIERDLKRTMNQQLEDLTKSVAILENRVHEMRAKYEGLEKRFQERRVADEKKHHEEVAFIKKGNQQLTAEIKRLTN
jgi:dynein light intermediate chain